MEGFDWVHQAKWKIDCWSCLILNGDLYGCSVLRISAYTFIWHLLCADALFVQLKLITWYCRTSSGLAYSKTFNRCKYSNSNFKLETSLLGGVVDWSDAEIKGLGSAVGKELAITLLKGCRVHWTRLWQRVRDWIATTKDKAREKNLFSSIASQIPSISAGSNLVITFEVLCKKKSADSLLGIIEGLTNDDVKFIDASTDWSPATKWVERWMRP